MVKLYAQAGQVWNIFKDSTMYDCGSFIASLRAGSAEELLVSVLCFDLSDFHEEAFLIFLMDMIKKEKTKDIVTKLRIRPKKVIKNLVDAHVLFEGKGNDEKEAIRDILDQASFWARVYPGSMSERFQNIASDYFFSTNNPRTLSFLEERILNLLTKNTTEATQIPPSKLHRKDTYRKHYITMDILERVFTSEGITRDEIYTAVERLYSKHCICFQDKVPFYTDYRESPFASIFFGTVALPVGKDIGLERVTIPFDKFLEEEYKKGNLDDWLKAKAKEREEADAGNIKEKE